MTQPQLNLDITKSTPIKTKEGEQIWQQGYILRKFNKFIIGSDEDQIVPIPIFYDPKTGEICKEGMPSHMNFLFEE